MHKRIISSIIAAACLQGAVMPSASVFAESAVSEHGDLLTYSLCSDNTAVITGCDPDVTWVDLSQPIDGHLISSVGDNAFSECVSLKCVYLGNNISSIGENAFSGTSIEAITIPPSVHEIGSHAFSGCKSLQTVCIYSYKGVVATYGENVFDKNNGKLSVYCPMGSGASAYCLDSGLCVKQSERYWFGKGVVSAQEALDQKLTEPTTNADSSVPEQTDKQTVANNDSRGNNISMSDNSNSQVDLGNQQTQTAKDSIIGQSSPSTAFDDTGAITLENGQVTGGTGDVPVGATNVSLDEKYASLPPVVQDTYNGNQTVYSSQYGSKIIKGSPIEGGYFAYEWHEYGNGYIFEPSGIFISKDDYVILCNCVALEYGANWVPIWEMALVAEVIFNKWHRGDADTIRNVITAPGQFEHSDWYSGLDTFSDRVNNRVIDAVNLYLAYPGYFTEGYTSFRGDGTWNYFW